MARRKAKKKKPAPSPKKIEPGPLGHNPFQSLKNIKIEQKTPPPEIVPMPAPPEVEEEDIFESAMADVIPIDRDVTRVGAPVQPGRATNEVYSEDVEVLAHLKELVTGRAQFDIVDTDEYLEGYIKGINPIIMEKLRLGRYSIQAYLDLHGLTVREAAEDVRSFIFESVALGYRCVLLVHGRGLNSKDHIPVLKEQLQAMLLRGPVRKHILAFSSARPHDGGAGASYVLLRAKKKVHYK